MSKQSVKKGDLLIAEPFLGDRNFERSVVLLCEHNDKGSFGFVLNQKANVSLKDVLEEDILEDVPLFVGGPVQQDTLHFIHRTPDLFDNTVEIAKGIFWGGDYEQLKAYLRVGKLQEQDIRFFLGYSGWGEEQLDQELGQNSWVVSASDAKFIFDTEPDQFWRGVLRRMGGKYKVMSHYPTDPRLN
ncbi:YqgE/AlgH family protein [Microscilla marina]|uniref:UPF0301 protein M23134_01239 n=1 Tax=Microscilla marina ATCC 23134 TaxID=313606 RepID=A1ZFZ1_MICM2|nr:YqgE/AlgH family protein [Microscilla marina]EAY30915.1 conserved hypothetical protein [Microscilla marina ATCC 23134]